MGTDSPPCPLYATESTVYRPLMSPSEPQDLLRFLAITVWKASRQVSCVSCNTSVCGVRCRGAAHLALPSSVSGAMHLRPTRTAVASPRNHTSAFSGDERGCIRRPYLGVDRSHSFMSASSRTPGCVCRRGEAAVIHSNFVRYRELRIRHQCLFLAVAPSALRTAVCPSSWEGWVRLVTTPIILYLLSIFFHQINYLYLLC